MLPQIQSLCSLEWHGKLHCIYTRRSWARCVRFFRFLVDFRKLDCSVMFIEMKSIEFFDRFASTDIFVCKSNDEILSWISMLCIESHCEHWDNGRKCRLETKHSSAGWKAICVRVVVVMFMDAHHSIAHLVIFFGVAVSIFIHIYVYVYKHSSIWDLYTEPTPKQRRRRWLQCGGLCKTEHFYKIVSLMDKML